MEAVIEAEVEGRVLGVAPRRRNEVLNMSYHDRTSLVSRTGFQCQAVR